MASAADAGGVTWSSRPAFLLATIGGAVGLGNLWRFPYVAGDNGGGGFVLIYLAFVFLLGLPVIAGEMLLGRRGHRSAVNSIADLVRHENAHPFWRAIGWLSLAVPFVGLSYYAVVAAWSIDYLALAAVDSFRDLDTEASQVLFAQRIDRPVYQTALHAAFIGITIWAIARGVHRGIERLSTILMPALFGMIILLVIYGIVEGDFGAAVRFLFQPDFSEIDGRAVLIALGQALFSLAIGAGVLITYSSYMPREFSIRSSATAVCVGDTLAALLAGLAIFPIVFASGLDPAEGPGLVFVTLPMAFGAMPGGHVVGVLFFLLLLFAAYTTALGMLEPVVAWLAEKNAGARRRMALAAGAAIWLTGLGSVLSFSTMSDFYPLRLLGLDVNFFGLADFTVANVLLPVNAFLIAAFAGWVIDRSIVDEEFAGASRGWRLYWRYTNRYVAPIAIGIVLIDLVTG